MCWDWLDEDKYLQTDSSPPEQLGMGEGGALVLEAGQLMPYQHWKVLCRQLSPCAGHRASAACSVQLCWAPEMVSALGAWTCAHPGNSGQRAHTAFANLCAHKCVSPCAQELGEANTSRSSPAHHPWAWPQEKLMGNRVI